MRQASLTPLIPPLPHSNRNKRGFDVDLQKNAVFFAESGTGRVELSVGECNGVVGINGSLFAAQTGAFFTQGDPASFSPKKESPVQKIPSSHYSLANSRRPQLRAGSERIPT
jgi:hypothetical protein